MRSTLYQHLTQPPQQPPAIGIGGWQAPLATPVRKAALTAAVLAASGLVVAPYVAAPGVGAGDVMFSASNSIVPYAKNLLYPAVQEPVPVAEVVTLDKWFAAASQPTPRKSDIASKPSLTFVGSDAATDARWFTPLGEPVRLRMLPVSEQPSLSFVQSVSPGLGSGDVMFAACNNIVPYSKSLLYPAVQQPVPLNAAEVVTIDKWFAPASQPVLPKRGLPTYRQLGFTAPAFVPAPSVTSWFATLSGPLRPLYRGLASYEQSALSLVKATPFAESVTADRWFQPLSLPVRRKVSVAYHPAAFWGLVTPATAVIGPLDNPEDFVLYTAEIETWFLTDRTV